MRHGSPGFWLCPVGFRRRLQCPPEVRFSGQRVGPDRRHGPPRRVQLEPRCGRPRAPVRIGGRGTSCTNDPQGSSGQKACHRKGLLVKSRFAEGISWSVRRSEDPSSALIRPVSHCHTRGSGTGDSPGQCARAAESAPPSCIRYQPAPSVTGALYPGTLMPPRAAGANADRTRRDCGREHCS
jgi:hypothetical protein